MPKTEIQKMRDGEAPDFQSPELQDSFRHAKELLARMRTLSTYSDEYRDLLEALIPGIPHSSVICPPFHCDHGHGIRIGHNVYINAGCTFLDGAWIRIGDRTLIGPAVQIYTPHHPLDYRQRRTGREYSRPVTIGADCWIGGGAILCPGVTIGDRTVIGAGSVVTRNIPSDSLAAGNPCRVIRRLNDGEEPPRPIPY